ncbi:MAG: hypothetical protein ABIH34_06370 [Nanoarchaeota archaeon]
MDLMYRARQSILFIPLILGYFAMKADPVPAPDFYASVQPKDIACSNGPVEVEVKADSIQSLTIGAMLYLCDGTEIPLRKGVIGGRPIIKSNLISFQRANEASDAEMDSLVARIDAHLDSSSVVTLRGVQESSHFSLHGAAFGGEDVALLK